LPNNELEGSWDSLSSGTSGRRGSNVRKHGVSFEDAATVFGDPLTVTILDPAMPRGESRFITIGQALSGNTLVVVHLDDDDTISGVDPL
jgi:hypothetical protein